MTYEQFGRWQDFAIRMAQHCYPKATEARIKKIIEEVKSYFDERKLQKDWPVIMDWDGNKDDFYLCDDTREFFDEYRHWNRYEEDYTGKFYNQIICCIRSGFDIAVEQSGGVVGFTAGDIRRMYNGEVPNWVKEHWNVSFEIIADCEGLWL